MEGLRDDAQVSARASMSSRPLDKPDAPLWEGMLEDGDLLYIPRGWWHVATPLDEPTLHLTVGVNNLTKAPICLPGSSNRLQASEDVRRIFRNSPRRRADRLMDRLREMLHRRVAAGLDRRISGRA